MDAYGVSASSSSNIHEKYDVFLSFRGEDTRNNFTSHLYAALRRKQIETFMDDKSLEKGDEITLAVPKAIQNSKISIIIFSKDYASSAWCLRELVRILECRREYKQMVIPIFYEADPSHIRKQKGSYEKSFLEHEVRFEEKMEMVKTWRAALTESADLSGWDSQITSPEAQLVEAIADDVLRKLNCVPSSYIGRQDLIGIEEHIQKIELLLSLGSPDIRIVGIWGLGGIGKTTLADALFNKHFYQFESHCFLANVREYSEKINLRNKLLGELLKEENMNLGTPFSIPSQVKDMLRRKKVLIVLDDVNDTEQLHCLVGDRGLFGHESRIIITTRDAKVLKDIEADEIYKLEQLNYNDALQLFKLKAFRGISPTTDYANLSKEVVKYAGGIPLAINTLASRFRSLHPKRIENWETILDDLKQVSHDDIEKKLRITYDGLNKKEQAIFLDIACFFKGENREMIENILNGCGFGASILINDLIDKSLLTIIYNDDDRLWMHDLIQDMGWKIVQQESGGQPGQKSRFWMAKDAYWILNNNEGTQNIEGIFLDMAKINKELHLRPEVFQKMCKLRLLKIHNTIICDKCYVRWKFIFGGCNHVKRNKVHLREDLESLPRTLGYLHWEGYPSKHLPSNFEPQSLVEINMPYSQLEKLSQEVQDFEKLRSIDLRHSIHLTQFPDISHVPKLEKLNLEGCTSLLQLPLNSLQMIPFRSLTSLNLSSTAIDHLPSSICSLNNLFELSLNYCKGLANLPSNMSKMDSLKDLQLAGCSSLEKFPELPWNIQKLDICRTAIKVVPSSSIVGRSSLYSVDMSDCRSLESLPTVIFELESLKELDLDGCSDLKNLPGIPKSTKSSLEYLNLSRTGIRQLPSSIEHLSIVGTLIMSNCQNLEFVPSNIYKMYRVFPVNLSNCRKLESFPTATGFLEWCVAELDLSNSNITEIPSRIKEFSYLTELKLSNCKNLRSLSELPLSSKVLDANGCTSSEVVTDSNRALTQEFWDYYDTNLSSNENYYSICCDCLKLDQQERRNVEINLEVRALHSCIRFVSAMEKSRGRDPSILWKNRFRVCYPGNEIPEWVEYPREGASIDITLPEKWQNEQFLGFVACVVGDSYSATKELDIKCEFCLKHNQGKNRNISWVYASGSSLYMLPAISNSCNTYILYELQDYLKCLDAVEASFYFSFQDSFGNRSAKVQVKKCGIHMLSRQDLEKFEFSFQST